MKNRGTRVQQMLKMLKTITNINLTNIQPLRIYMTTTFKNHVLQSYSSFTWLLFSLMYSRCTVLYLIILEGYSVYLGKIYCQVQLFKIFMKTFTLLDGVSY